MNWTGGRRRGALASYNRPKRHTRINHPIKEDEVDLEDASKSLDVQYLSRPAKRIHLGFKEAMSFQHGDALLKDGDRMDTECESEVQSLISDKETTKYAPPVKEIRSQLNLKLESNEIQPQAGIEQRLEKIECLLDEINIKLSALLKITD
ncbi:hypothetical protein DSO57_1015163 [Entomophthora muscae]|uniref:Uncharacterized protein n=1 Tax=Entomophthora muscae TaxID=34485 RepID=A0ACC2RJR6_9FUNG|nr:hypothetical protein DSO57_1015163 [Entomophthora muscae]